jgi:hypothetical protein
MWPAVMWEVYMPPELGGKPPLGYRRSIAVSNDGGRWTFDDIGEPFAFEQLDRYRSRRLRDRFTPEMLREYLGHFGLSPLSDDFYKVTNDRPAIILEECDPKLPEGLQMYTLEQTLAGEPWQRD